MDCLYAYDSASSCYSGGNPSELKNLVNSGSYFFVDEFSHEWQDTMLGFCNDTSPILAKISITEMITVDNNEDITKRALLQYGPLSACPRSGHISTLVGFKSIVSGDSLNLGSTFMDPFIVISDQNPLIGRTYWIFKEPVGFGHGINGYTYILGNGDEMPTSAEAFAFTTPVSDLLDTTLNQEWHDYDGDGYYFWGIGSKPAGCPGPDLEDCNDDDSTRLYYNENMFCTFDCDLIAQTYSNDTLFINSDTTLYSQMLLQPIVVQQNATFILRGEFLCAEHVFIQTEIGGNIVASGATFNSLCAKRWEGFRVFANLDSTQGLVGRSMLMLNNTSIEDAKYAVYGDAGAIVRATNSDFLNNYCDVYLEPHVHSQYYSGVPINNTSEFNNCLFYTHSHLHTDTCTDNIRLLLTKDVAFNDCSFIDDGIQGNGFHHENRTAINTYASGFIVENCQFNGIGKAIAATNGLYYPIDISDNSFDKCHYSVYLSVSHGVNVTNNIIGFYGSACDTTSAEVPPYGIYLDECNGFQVEGNTIGYYGSSSTFYNIPICGIVANDVYSFEEVIYRNTFRNINIGTEAIGINKDASFPTLGLQISCNNHTRILNDIFVTNNLDDPYPPGSPVGIAGNQGSMQSPAGNRFTYLANQDYVNILNSEAVINYYHHDPATSGMRPDSVYGDVFLFNTHTSFTSGFCIDLTIDTVGNDTLIILPELFLLSEGIEEINITLQTLTDGGNTELTVAEIVLANDNNAWQTYIGLMDKSPYLSKEVLTEVARKEEALTAPMVRNVLLANPQAAKDPEIMKILDMRIGELPPYMIDQINSGLTQISPKEYLEMQKADLSNQLYQKTSKQMRYYIRHPQQYSDSDIEDLLSIDSHPQYKIQLADYYASKRNYQEAVAVLNNINVSDDFTQNETQNLIELYNLLDSFLSDTVLINTLGENSISALFAFVDNGGRAGAFARGLLQLNGVLNYREPLYLPEIVDTRKTVSNSKKPNQEFFKVYPNPAEQYITVEYDLENIKESAILKIVSTNSKPVCVKEIQNTKDCILIDLKEFTSGNYIIYIEVNGSIIDREILSIIK